MRNIFLFIRRYLAFLVFFGLQLIALWMLFKYNRFHRAVGLGVASEMNGRISRQVDKLDDYFHQGDENLRVHRTNDSLLNLLRSNFSYPVSDSSLRTDSVMLNDSTSGIRRYVWREAKVVYNTIKFEKNYLQIDRGSKLGISDNMAVLNSDLAIVGQVVNVSNNFSSIMSLLHVQNAVSASLKNSGETGELKWDGKDPSILVLRGIPRSVPVKNGDTVLTSRFSYNYPPGYMIGRVAAIENDPASGLQLIKVRTAVNFATIQQVFVVQNLQREEQVQLQKETEEKMDQQKRNR
jgi:rod shape-determining protein MreC